MKASTEEAAAVVRNPENPHEPLVRREQCLVGAESGTTFPIHASGMIDFVAGPGAAAAVPAAPASAPGLLFRLNEFYNTRFEQAVMHSWFAAGGPGLLRVRARLRQWLAPVTGLVVDVGSGAEQWSALVAPGARYLSLDYLPVSAFSPWRTAFPNINGDALRMPVRDAVADAVINASVIEHVRDPRRLVAEMARILKPGGLLMLVGPGDLQMSHGEPYHFFNPTKHGYRMLLEENGLEPVEELIPSRFWMTVAGLVYQNLVRNGAYNRSALHKLVQLPVFAASLALSPLANLAAALLDALLPFDERGYSVFMVLARKKAA
jgi:SAM-dependent methyltransferase